MIKGKTLYVSDMDGTLLGSDGRVSDRTAGIITRLSYLGVPITVATARTPATVRPLLAHTHTIVDAVVMTGAAMWSRADNVYTDVRYMSAADVRRGLDLCAECGVHPFVYTMGEDRRSLDVYHRARELNKAEEGEAFPYRAGAAGGSCGRNSAFLRHRRTRGCRKCCKGTSRALGVCGVLLSRYL